MITPTNTPYACGHKDASLGNLANPHYISMRGIRPTIVSKRFMTLTQIEEYHRGYRHGSAK